jgi:hypothetical protein
MFFGLEILDLTLVLQVIDQPTSLLFQSPNSPNPKHSHLVTKGEIIYKSFPYTHHPPQGHMEILPYGGIIHH